MKKTIKIVSFILITCGILFFTYRVLSWKDTTGAYVSSIEQLKNTPDNTIDVVFVGSSHVYCGCAPHVLWNDYGISAFDMSISGMDRYSAYYHTKYLLKTQKPKVVAVDLFALAFDKHAVVANEYRNMMSVPLSKDVVEQIKAYNELVEEEEDSKDRITDYILRWPIIHTRYKELGKGDFFTTPENTYIRGEGLNGKSRTVDFSVVKTYTDVGDLTKEQMKWLDDFVDLSEEYGFKLVFFVTPYVAQYPEMLTINAAGEYVSGKKNVTFINGIFAEDLKFDYDKDFHDFGHLSSKGAEVHTRWLYDKILKDCGLKNHKGDSRYEAWNQDSVYQACQVLNNNIEEYLDTAKHKEAAAEIQKSGHLIYTLVFTENWSKYPIVANLLYNLGFEEKDFKSGGVVIGQGNNVILAFDGIGEKEVYYDYDRYTTLKIEGNGVFINDVKIGMDDILKFGSNVAVSLWDLNVQRMILEKEF